VGTKHLTRIDCVVKDRAGEEEGSEGGLNDSLSNRGKFNKKAKDREEKPERKSVNLPMAGGTFLKGKSVV